MFSFKRPSKFRRLVQWTSVIIIGIIFIFFAINALTYERDPKLGVSFSTQYSEYLGLDSYEVYEAVINEMNISQIRIPIYWDEIQETQEQYDFSKIDYIMDRAEQEDINVTLAIGLKVPRWPECFVPDWTEPQSQAELKQSFFSMMYTVVSRYKDHPALERWQVENEPFFPFGECPLPQPSWYYQEIDYVRMLDPYHEIQSTTSGEQSLWFLRVRGIDVLGVSLYREVWNNTIGTFVFPHAPIIYSIQRMLIEPFVDSIIISELQMEPWIPEYINGVDFSIEDLYAMFPVEDMEQSFYFAKLTGVDEIDLWGVEWWYYMKEHGESRLWEKGKEFFSSSTD